MCNILGLSGVVPHVHHNEFADVVDAGVNIKNAIKRFRPVAL
jgi:hypothetical protein